MLLKESKSHFEAFKYAQKKNNCSADIFRETIHYLYQLCELDPRAVKIVSEGDRGAPWDNRGTFVLFLSPLDRMSPNEKYVPGNMELVGDMLEIKLHIPFSQKGAAAYSGVDERTVQRWDHRGLYSFKIGKRKIYSGDDLDQFMEKIGFIHNTKLIEQEAAVLRQI